MRRGLPVLFLLLPMAALARTAEADFPIPPIPPAIPPPIDAPMPNLNAARPIEPQRGAHLSLDPGINHRQAPGPGYGYAPGAHYQVDNDRRFFVLPGVQWHVPFP